MSEKKTPPQKPSLEHIALWWIIAGFLILFLFLFRDIFLGKTVLAGDTLKSIPFTEWGKSEFFQHHRVGQWIPYLFAGMPAFGSFVTTPSSIIAILFSWILGSFIPFFNDPMALHLFHLVLLGTGTWLLGRHYRWRVETALIIALGMVLMPTLLSLVGVGHTIKLWTFSYVPLVMLMFERITDQPTLRRTLWGGLIFSFMLQIHHLQIIYYFLLAMGVYFLIRVIQLHLAEKNLKISVKRIAGLAAAVLLGLMLTSFLYIQVANYSQYSLRSSSSEKVQTGEYAGDYSYPLSDLTTWLTPSSKGFGGSNYWGDLMYTAFPLYMGLPLLLLALAANFWIRSPRIIALSAGALFLLLIGMGKYTGPLFDVWLQVLPFFGKFRAHMWAIGITQILLTIMAGFALDKLLRLKSTETGTIRKVILGFAGLGVIIFIYAQVSIPQKSMSPGNSFLNGHDRSRVVQYFQSQGQNLTNPQIQQVLQSIRVQRAGIYYKDLRWTGVIVATGSIVLWLTLQGTIGGLWLVLLFGAVIFADTQRVNSRTITFEQKQHAAEKLAPDQIIRQLKAETQQSQFRVYPWNIYGYNELVYWDLQSVTGYQGAKLKRMQDLIDKGSVNRMGASMLHPNILDILNVKYVISPVVLLGMQQVLALDNEYLLQRDTQCPRAYFPARVTKLSDTQDVFARLLADDFRPQDEVILQNDPPFQPVVGENTVQIVSYDAPRIELEVSNTTPTLLVLSEMYYPSGWKAYVDDAEVPIFPANYVNRAIPIEKTGTHTVVFEFNPMDYRIGKWISIFTLLIVVGGLILLHRNKK